VDYSSSERILYDTRSVVSLSLPRWRKILWDNDHNSTRVEWTEAMETLGLDCYRYGFPNVTGRNDSLEQASPRTRLTEEKQEFSFLPRFKWGDFETISYCWEWDIREKEIMLNGMPFAVPKNLEALLQALQRKRCTDSTMKFWVDALCISQNDVAERNHQVKLMKKIYHMSFAVTIWLGEADEETDIAVDFIAELSTYTLDYGGLWGRGGYGPRFDENWIESGHGGRLSWMPWKALLAFFSCNYWQRFWIIQELAPNHNMTLFMCGDRQLSRGLI